MPAFKVGELAGELIVRIRVDELALVLASERDAMQRWDSRIYVAGFNQRPHIPVEQREQQDADMRAVNIGIGHHDDLVVPCLAQVEARAGTRAHHLDDRGAFLVGQHLRQARLLHVENLASNRQ